MKPNKNGQKSGWKYRPEHKVLYYVTHNATDYTGSKQKRIISLDNSYYDLSSF